MIAKIGSAFGLHGWVWLDSFTCIPKDVFSFTPWSLRPCVEKNKIELGNIFENLKEPSFWKARSDRFIVQFESILDRNQAEELTNFEVFIESKQLPQILSKDEFYWKDLIGCRVKNLQGCDFGLVSHLLATGANDVLVVRNDKQSDGGKEKESLIPFIKAVILEVNLDSLSLTIDWEKDF